QIYPHKLITGRFNNFDGIRTRGGLMGYPNPHESEYDLFMTGHAGCSVSTALGLKSGDDLLGETGRKSVAVVGHGALVSGMLFEEMGFRYYGPVNGHDLPSLRRTLQDVKHIEGPVLLHVFTEKGHGHPQAALDPVTYHTPPVFEQVSANGSVLALRKGGSRAYTDAARAAITETMET